jgi:hypothetical protein
MLKEASCDFAEYESDPELPEKQSDPYFGRLAPLISDGGTLISEPSLRGP